VMTDTSVSPLTTATVTSENNTSSAVIKSRKRLRDECKWKKMSQKVKKILARNTLAYQVKLCVKRR